LVWVAFGGKEGGECPGKPSPEVGQELADVVSAGAESCEEGIADGLRCTNPVRDSSLESVVVAGLHEQTYTPRLQDQELARL